MRCVHLLIRIDKDRVLDIVEESEVLRIVEAQYLDLWVHITIQIRS
jgi:hypothetical protein